MTNNHKNKLAMIKAVIAYLLTYTAILDLLPALKRALTRLQGIASNIDDAVIEQNNSVAGVLDARDDAEEVLIGLADEVSSALAAYASENKLPEVFAISSVKRRKLEGMSNIELVQKAKAINTLAKQYAQQIVEFGATAEKLAALEPAITAFEASVGKFTTGLDTRSGAVSSLKTMFRQADEELKERMDEIVNNIKDKEPQFFVGYKTARVIHDMGGGHGGSGTGGTTPPTDTPKTPPTTGGTPK